MEKSEINMFCDAIEASLEDYQAVIFYLGPLIGTDVLPDEAEHHMVSEYARERFEDALSAINQLRIDTVDGAEVKSCQTAA